MDLYLVPDYMLDDCNYITVDKCKWCLALVDVNDLEEHEGWHRKLDKDILPSIKIG